MILHILKQVVPLVPQTPRAQLAAPATKPQCLPNAVQLSAHHDQSQAGSGHFHDEQPAGSDTVKLSRMTIVMQLLVSSRPPPLSRKNDRSLYGPCELLAVLLGLLILQVPALTQSSCKAPPAVCLAGIVYIQDIIPSCFLCPGEHLKVTCNNTNGFIYLFDNGDSIGETANPPVWNESELHTFPAEVIMFTHFVTYDDDKMYLTCHCGSSPNDPMGDGITFYVMGDIPKPVNVQKVSGNSSFNNLEVLITWEAPILRYEMKPLDRKPTGYTITIVGYNKTTEYTVSGNTTTQQLNLSNYTAGALNVSVKTICGDLTSSASVIEIIVPSGDEPESSYAVSTSFSSSSGRIISHHPHMSSADYFDTSSFLPFISTFTRTHNMPVSTSPTISDNGNDNVVTIIIIVSIVVAIIIVAVLAIIIVGICVFSIKKVCSQSNPTTERTATDDIVAGLEMGKILKL